MVEILLVCLLGILCQKADVEQTKRDKLSSSMQSLKPYSRPGKLAHLRNRKCHKLNIPLERYVELIEVRLVDRQTNYEKYHDAIFNSLKSDVRNLRTTADLFLETSSKGNTTQELKNTIHALSTTVNAFESLLRNVEVAAQKNKREIDHIPATIDGKISVSEISSAKEINMLKETILTLRDEKKREVNNLKSEMSVLREEMKNDVIALKADIKACRGEYKADLRGAMSMMYYRLLIGVFGAAAMGVAAIQSVGSLASGKIDQ